VPDEPRELTVEELADRAGVSVRTVRFYISEGLLPGPGTRGRQAAYGEDHLLRLRLIRRLADRRVPLAEIKAQLERLSPEDLRALLAQEERQSVEEQRSARAPKAYISALLERARSSKPPPSAPMLGASLPAGTLGQASRPYERPEPGQDDRALWRRYLLAPGVELQVRADLVERYRTLIERLRALVRESAERGKK
jgi:DNA-binding transcriptional MerR regulator